MSAAVVVVSPDELAAIVEAAVARALAAAQPARASGAGLVTKSELARELSCSVATVDRMTREGCPFVTVGRTRRFDLAAVRVWLETRTERPAPAEPEPERSTGVRLLSRGVR